MDWKFVSRRAPDELGERATNDRPVESNSNFGQADRLADRVADEHVDWKFVLKRATDELTERVDWKLVPRRATDEGFDWKFVLRRATGERVNSNLVPRRATDVPNDRAAEERVD